jgi:hypothetical protein
MSKVFLFEVYGYGYDTELMYEEIIASSKEEAQIKLFEGLPKAYILNVFVKV